MKGELNEWMEGRATLLLNFRAGVVVALLLRPSYNRKLARWPASNARMHTPSLALVQFMEPLSSRLSKC